MTITARYAARPQIYAVTNRYGTRRTFSNRREAERYAAAERRDGWTAGVSDLRQPAGNRAERA